MTIQQDYWEAKYRRLACHEPKERDVRRAWLFNICDTERRIYALSVAIDRLSVALYHDC